MGIKRRDIASINKIILHCSDSNNPAHDDIKVITQWHKLRGFYTCGYHWFIKNNGTYQKGRELWEIGAHCKNHNNDSIGICLSGKNNFTLRQLKAAAILVRDLIDVLGWKRVHNKYEHLVFPHSHFDRNKTCPNFDIKMLFAFRNVDLVEYSKIFKE